MHKELFEKNKEMWCKEAREHQGKEVAMEFGKIVASLKASAKWFEEQHTASSAASVTGSTKGGGGHQVP